MPHCTITAIVFRESLIIALAILQVGVVHSTSDALDRQVHADAFHETSLKESGFSVKRHNMSLANSILANHSTPDFEECMRLCMELAFCNSINHQSTESKCELNSLDSKIGRVIHRRGWTYLEKTK